MDGGSSSNEAAMLSPPGEVVVFACGAYVWVVFASSAYVVVVFASGA